MANVTRGKNFKPTKSKILHIVAKKFLEKGYSGTTLRELAGEANVSYSSLINIFESKEGLLNELVGHVLECQRISVERELASEKVSPLYRYAVERALQLLMAESSEHMREMYSISYSLPESSKIIYERCANRLADIFADRLKGHTLSDFYELELAAAGVMRNYMIAKCDMYFTMKVKLDALLRTTFRLFLVPEDEIDEIILFVSALDIKGLADRTLSGLLEYLNEKT
ncbi:MAG: TetR/AcrR family transcriptional regulator [Clostridia bacterium]|nr:TetR/AcrR family transcriptional regulator [Clostridia bacterium]